MLTTTTRVQKAAELASGSAAAFSIGVCDASIALTRLANENPENQLSIAKGLVALLDSGSTEAQEHAARALRTLARDPSNQAAIAEAGSIEPLVALLSHGSPGAQEQVAGALASLSCETSMLLRRRH